jgi:hypothetical protein
VLLLDAPNARRPRFGASNFASAESNKNGWKIYCGIGFRRPCAYLDESSSHYRLLIRVFPGCGLHPNRRRIARYSTRSIEWMIAQPLSLRAGSWIVRLSALCDPNFGTTRGYLKSSLVEWGLSLHFRRRSIWDFFWTSTTRTTLAACIPSGKIERLKVPSKRFARNESASWIPDVHTYRTTN